MKNQDKKKEPIIIKETPEMANWMHPQTEERKKMIEETVERVKERMVENRKRIMENNTRCLIVEDGVFPRATLSSLCEKYCKTMPLVATTITEAIEIYKEKQREIDIIFLSLLMPEMYAFEGIKELLKINPKAYIVGTGKTYSTYSFSIAKKLGVKKTLASPYEEPIFAEMVIAYLKETEK